MPTQAWAYLGRTVGVLTGSEGAGGVDPGVLVGLLTVEPDRLAPAGLHQGDLGLRGLTRVVPAVHHFTIPRSQRDKGSGGTRRRDTTHSTTDRERNTHTVMQEEDKYSSEN